MSVLRAVPDLIPALDVVEVLEQMLVEAKAGKILGFLAVTSEAGGETASVISVGPDASIMALLGEFEATKLRFMREHIDGCGL